MSLGFSPKSKWVVRTQWLDSADAQFTFVNPRDLSVTRTFRGYATSATFSPDAEIELDHAYPLLPTLDEDETRALAIEDGHVAVIDLETGRTLQRLDMDVSVDSCQFGGSKHLVCGNEKDKSIYVVNLENGRVRKSSGDYPRAGGAAAYWTTHRESTNHVYVYELEEIVSFEGDYLGYSPDAHVVAFLRRSGPETAESLDLYDGTQKRWRKMPVDTGSMGRSHSFAFFGDRVVWSTDGGDHANIHVARADGTNDHVFTGKGCGATSSLRAVSLDGDHLVMDSTCSLGCPSVRWQQDLRTYSVSEGREIARELEAHPTSYADDMSSRVNELERFAKQRATTRANIADVRKSHYVVHREGSDDLCHRAALGCRTLPGASTIRALSKDGAWLVRQLEGSVELQGLEQPSVARWAVPD